jgi:hypothetical protein
MEWIYLLAMAQEGASVGNAMKNYVVISWPCTKGSVHGAKWRLFSHLASDEITKLWVKLCNLFRVYDSCVHGHERHGPFTRFVGVWLVCIYRVFWVQLVWFVVCSRCEAYVHDLATGGMPVSVGWFWLQV